MTTLFARMRTAVVCVELAIVGTLAMPDARAQQADNSKVELQEVVVQGVRAAFENAQALKQASDQIQESVTAEDIGKMPDNNVAETLQRLTGVQVNRDLGEGQYVAIRGLTQVQSELNGRPIFSADGNGRSLNYENVPSELLAGADVFKSPTADQIDGGIGGLINFRTRRPFDFDGLKVAGSVRAAYGDQVRKAGFSESFLISDRWNTSVGDMGALLSVSNQRRQFQRDFDKNADYKAHTLVDAQGNNLYPTRTCEIPGSAPGTVCMSEANYEQPDEGRRDRLGVNAALQWRPNESTTVYVDATGANFESLEKVLGSFPCPVCAPSIAASDVVFSTSRPNDVISATYANVPLINDNYYGKNTNKDRQVAAGVTWTGNQWNVLAEATTAKTTHTGYFMLLEQQAVAPSMIFDQRTTPATFGYPGLDLADPNTWHYASVYYSPNETRGKQNAIKWDAEWKPDRGWLKGIKFGMRYGKETHSADSVSSFNAVNGPNLGGNSIPLEVSSHTDLFSNTPKGWITPNVDVMSQPGYVFSVFGLTPPGAFDPHNHFSIDETTLASYALLKFEGQLGLPFSGNVGVRFVTTRDSDDGWLNAGGVFTPFHTKNNYNDALPSINVKFTLADDLLLRLAGSKVLTRPDFPSLNPTVQIDNFFLTASGGNPNLAPLTATQFDSSLEWYFSRSAYMYGAYFYKHVNNFIFTSQDYETFNGQSFLTSHPTNGRDGKINGLELGYQQFFTFLPAPFDGLGMIVNGTYIDSRTPSPVQGIESPLPQLSKYSYNLIGVYERGPVSLRVAYNWRSKYIETLGTNASGIQPEVRKAYGILDMSTSYKLTDKLLVTFEAQNLTKPLRTTYYSIPEHVAESQTEDRYYALGVRFNF